MSDAQGGVMPIVTRPPGPDPTVASRSGDECTIGITAPPEDLLPSGGAPPLAPALAPHRALALDALRLLPTLHDHPRDAGHWGEPAFAREVDLVRGHLGPIRSRRGLAASFSREASLDRGPVCAAYAIRWLELGDGVRRPGWTSLVADRG